MDLRFWASRKERYSTEVSLKLALKLKKSVHKLRLCRLEKLCLRICPKIEEYFPLDHEKNLLITS